MKRVLTALAAVLVVSTAWAESSPAGLWKTVDDATKLETSQVRITETNGVFSGHIEKLLGRTRPDAVCVACTDDRKGKPILGLPIIRGVTKNADHEDLWDGGTILDPANGKSYKLRLRPSEDGKKLEVRGYVGAPMFGRSQTWIRVE